MNEQSKEDSDEVASYNPFLLTRNEYDPTTRLRMAEEMATSRRLYVSQTLKEIIGSPEDFYHDGQQSWKMSDDASKRRQMSFNTKREAYIHQRRADGLPLPSKIPMIEINPTRVTLTMEFESQYYPLMTNDYGDHENVASIMKETNTLIQLPDRFEDGSDPDSCPQEVAITGDYRDVDNARKLMRKNCHVSVIMPLSQLKASNHEIQTFVGQNHIKNVDMSFMYLPEKKGDVKSYLRFTSRQKNQDQLIAAANELLKKFYDNACPYDDFSLHFTVSSTHFDYVLRSSNFYTMPRIEKFTKTRIIIPRKKESRNCLMVLEVKGAVENILKARKCMLDILPITLSFNISSTDMRVSPNETDRTAEFSIEARSAMLKFCRSAYEPRELLSNEVALHNGNIRSREFNIKCVYMAYQKLFSERLNVVAPQPTDHDNSFWNASHFTEKGNKHNAPSRCDSEEPRSYRRQETSSSRSKSSQGSTVKSSSESSENPARHHARVSSISESATQPTQPLPAYQETIAQTPFPHMLMMPPFVKDGSGIPIPFVPIYVNPAGLPFHADVIQFDPFTFCPIQPTVRPISEAEQSTCRPESSNSVRSQNSNHRKQSRGLNRPNSASASFYHSSSSSSSNRPQRGFERFRDDDVRSSPRSRSGRTSVSGDEPLTENFDERGRQYQQPCQRYQKDDGPRWKTGSRGDIHSKRNIPINKDSRSLNNIRDHDFNVGTPERAPSADQIQFQSTHHLKLKPNEIDFEHERFFINDSPHMEQNGYSAGRYEKEMTEDDVFRQLFSNTNLKESGKRSRAVSCYFDRENPTARMIDSDGGFIMTDYAMTQTSRSIDSFKKIPGVVVGKTMLEPRCRNERDYRKINLEHKDRNNSDLNEGERYQEPVSSLSERRFRMDPMQLIASVRESSEQLPRIHERQFNDILNEKGKSSAACRERNSELAIVQEKTS